MWKQDANPSAVVVDRIHRRSSSHLHLGVFGGVESQIPHTHKVISSPIEYTDRERPPSKTLIFGGKYNSNNKKLEMAVKVGRSASIDVEMNHADENGVEDEEDDCVDEDCFVVGLHAAELKRAVVAVVTGNLEENPRLEDDEQHYPDQNRSPVRHC